MRSWQVEVRTCGDSRPRSLLVRLGTKQMVGTARDQINLIGGSKIKLPEKASPRSHVSFMAPPALARRPLPAGDVARRCWRPTVAPQNAALATLVAVCL